jgi:hypothetical protein
MPGKADTARRLLGVIFGGLNAEVCKPRGSTSPARGRVQDNGTPPRHGRKSPAGGGTFPRLMSADSLQNGVTGPSVGRDIADLVEHELQQCLEHAAEGLQQLYALTFDSRPLEGQFVQSISRGEWP